MKSKEYLKKHRVNTSLPTRVRFTTKFKRLRYFEARKFQYVLPLDKVKVYTILIKEEIKQRIKSHNLYCMGDILDEDISYWLDITQRKKRRLYR
jgi:hypothetical protein